MKRKGKKSWVSPAITNIKDLKQLLNYAEEAVDASTCDSDDDEKNVFKEFHPTRL